MEYPCWDIRKHGLDLEVVMADIGWLVVLGSMVFMAIALVIHLHNSDDEEDK